jgi:hypothetical protein
MKMNYYKITNEKEIHNGLQYQTGINSDPVSFNPSGDCQKGGIYFAREDILAFLNYGTYIRKVTIPSDAKIYKNPGFPKKFKADKVILGRKRKISFRLIKKLVQEGADIHADNDCALRFASESGHFDIVKYLVEKGASGTSYVTKKHKEGL